MSAADDYDDGGPSLPVRPLTVVTDLTVIYPLLFLGALYAEWLLAWAVLGHQPRVSLDDPKDIPGSNWLGLLVMLLMVGYWPVGCVSALLIGLGAMLGRLRGRRLWMRVLGFLVFWPGSFALLWWDPLRVAEWWID